MSVGGSAGGAPSAYEPKKLRMYGLVGSIVGIYLGSILNSALNTEVFSFIGALAAIFAVVMGANSVRRVCAYGIGTGVPSIGMLALGMGIIAVMFGLSVAETLGFGMLGPIITLIYAGVFGYIIGVIANKVIKFNIPVMEEGNADLSMAGALAILGWSFAISGTLGYEDIVTDVLMTGYIAIIFIAGGLAILHPFNANLGPDEKQDRTLVNAIMVGGLAMTATGIGALLTQGLSEGLLQIVIGFAIWYYFFKMYYKLVKRDASAVVGTGLLPPTVQ
ncbi:MAG: tetrahydromethanopterin S-methyltransferase subunit C [Methanothrix soehngenii]|jgi:tetrahydromethanopterin S-methyltransferase subunit C|uniref:tetrahydromethanopterin S-methyltransferase subunit MtrC n=1 Tax=Methanothrix soehngenii TaxID=2223 RepID=UPI002353357D|nr:tetrahydromethanopterin S-methyltransferase subunit C [Methanothrix soehngenii]MCK9587724.1 tetrahydromethanopterin S-methyltransferase subunit C [Methanothrix soehngenii]MDD3973919.1 tetrahydromethanopterin S-methyltransferase subunit C [Methanothrix soehngenii]MDD4487673.1 tetrahydromethanopterin S-methyltransferase subunit C [Methanothrix soehngenii]MDD5733922.1 tetrahydromethanopterin S-methyltransferase subunit C [Methanothrix soehngenii]MDY0412144.1 tetrahydromethanopterin S-methyltra